MKEQSLIEALRVLVDDAFECVPEAGRPHRFNVSFHVGNVEVKISCTADNMLFRMEMEAQYWKGDGTSVHTKTPYGKRRGGMALATSLPPIEEVTPTDAFDQFFREVAAINEQLKAE